MGKQRDVDRATSPSQRAAKARRSVRIWLGLTLAVVVSLTAGCGTAADPQLAVALPETEIPGWVAEQLPPTPTATPLPTATATPEPTSTPVPEPTATVAPTPEPTASPAPLPQPTPTTEVVAEPTVAEPTAVAVQPSATSKPDQALPPTSYDGEVLALRSPDGVMLTVRSGGPAREVVTPCFNLAIATVGQEISGPIDVLIDPGHGGPETGAVGPNGLVEADLNLVVSEELNRRLTDLGYRVEQTRYSDHYVAIQARAELANALAPRVFVSIHHNGGFPSASEVPGTEIFAAKDNEPARRLAGLFFEEIQQEFAEDDLAWVATDAFGVSWRLNRSGTDLYGVLRRTAGLTSVLVEPMYLINAPEAELLAQPETAGREADAMTRAIVRFFDTEDPGSGFIDGLVFQGDLGSGGGTEGCTDPVIR